MKIKLPTKKGEPNTNPDLEFTQLVVIGANGSGKTRFGSRIEETNLGHTHRISAQKSLTFPTHVSPTAKDQAEIEFKYGAFQKDFKQESQYHNYKIRWRWGGNFNTLLLNDYEKLLILLHTEEYEDSLSYKEGRILKPITKLDTVQRIWEKVLPHRKLLKRAGVIETYPTGLELNIYNASEMSDGERVVFYLIGEVICVPSNSIIIIDEPEMHLHKSLIKKLFDLIEAERSDCSLVYLTHDIDFAFSRQNASKIWTKSYEGNNVWDYEILDDEAPISEQLYLEILGSRDPIIFLEGDESSIDYKLYQQVFSNYTLKPLGSCKKVIHTVKSFNDQNSFHNLTSFGIIDRDRRQDDDVKRLNENKIWVLDVAEVENLLLMENIVKNVANHMGKDADKVFNEVRDNLLTFFNSQLESQILIHFREILKQTMGSIGDIQEKNISEMISKVDEFYSKIDKQKLYITIKDKFESVVKKNDYEFVLRLFNLKNALIPNSRVCELTGIKNITEYINLIITLLKKGDSFSEEMKEEIDKKIIKSTT
jgi:hypothetical protein